MHNSRSKKRDERRKCPELMQMAIQVQQEMKVVVDEEERAHALWS